MGDATAGQNIRGADRDALAGVESAIVTALNALHDAERLVGYAREEDDRDEEICRLRARVAELEDEIAGLRAADANLMRHGA